MLHWGPGHYTPPKTGLLLGVSNWVSESLNNRCNMCGSSSKISNIAVFNHMIRNGYAICISNLGWPIIHIFWRIFFFFIMDKNNIYIYISNVISCQLSFSDKVNLIAVAYQCCRDLCINTFVINQFINWFIGYITLLFKYLPNTFTPNQNKQEFLIF